MRITLGVSLIGWLHTAGIGGSVLANRLREDPSVTVLVVEAGGEYVLGLRFVFNTASLCSSESNNPQMQVPFMGVRLPGGPADWKFVTTPQKGLEDRQIACARGKALGGTTRISECATLSYCVEG